MNKDLARVSARELEWLSKIEPSSQGMALVDLDSPPAWWSQAARNQHGTGWKVYVGLPLSTARFVWGFRTLWVIGSFRK